MSACRPGLDPGRVLAETDETRLFVIPGGVNTWQGGTSTNLPRFEQGQIYT